MTATASTPATLTPAQQRVSNEDLARFTAHAAHDLQEPLRLVAGYLDLLTAHMEGRAKLDGPKLARDAKEATERMQQLVVSLLEYTRLAHKPRNLERVPLARPLADALSNLKRRVRETSAQVTHGPLPTLVADHAQLTSLFQNVVENSLKYATQRSPVVHVMAQREGASWSIFIDDNGPGWPVQGRERLFEAFARLHDQSTAGNGLGLATVRVIAQRHGGTVRAEAAPSGGARIVITLPEPSP